MFIRLSLDMEMRLNDVTIDNIVYANMKSRRQPWEQRIFYSEGNNGQPGNNMSSTGGRHLPRPTSTYIAAIATRELHSVAYCDTVAPLCAGQRGTGRVTVEGVTESGPRPTPSLAYSVSSAVPSHHAARQ